MALSSRTKINLVALAACVVALGFYLLRREPPGSEPDVRPFAAQEEKSGAEGASAPATERAEGKTVYDPIKLLDNGVPPGEVFVEEPRTDAWADRVEAVLRAKMQSDLEAMVPEARVGVSCKTLSCVVGIDAPEEKRPAAKAVTQFIMLGPYHVEGGTEDDGTVRWLFFTEPRMADPEAFTSWYLNTRKITLQGIRAGTRENPLPVPKDEVPSE